MIDEQDSEADEAQKKTTIMCHYGVTPFGAVFVAEKKEEDKKALRVPFNHVPKSLRTSVHIEKLKQK